MDQLVSKLKPWATLRNEVIALALFVFNGFLMAPGFDQTRAAHVKPSPGKGQATR